MKSIKVFTSLAVVAFIQTVVPAYAGCDPACGDGETCGYNSESDTFTCRATKGFMSGPGTGRGDESTLPVQRPSGKKFPGGTTVKTIRMK